MIWMNSSSLRALLDRAWSLLFDSPGQSSPTQSSNHSLYHSQVGLMSQTSVWADWERGEPFSMLPTRLLVSGRWRDSGLCCPTPSHSQILIIPQDYFPLTQCLFWLFCFHLPSLDTSVLAFQIASFSFDTPVSHCKLCDNLALLLNVSLLFKSLSRYKHDHWCQDNYVQSGGKVC